MEKQLTAVLYLLKLKNLVIKALTITNVPGSTLSREADYTLLLHAGPEIAVASTKAYTAQLAVLAILAEVTARSKGYGSWISDLIKELELQQMPWRSYVIQRMKSKKWPMNI